MLSAPRPGLESLIQGISQGEEVADVGGGVVEGLGG